MRRVPRTLALAGLLILLAWVGSGAARIYGEMYCWALDAELPVACDEEDEEEEVLVIRDQVSGTPASPAPSLKPDP
jgi:hypothetical protein